ncbi:MAG: hypothetical protein K5636_08775 [Bacteroidales bacterium]|nr:hypothetical protein [Bacteroidales bacterium]
MKGSFCFFCFFLLFSTLVCGQSPISYNDHERIFVIGVRYFKEPVLVHERKSRSCVIIEKNNLSEDAEMDDDYYTQRWAFQPNSYCVLENADFIKKIVVPQMTDSIEKRVLLDQITPEGYHQLSINIELHGKKHKFKNLIYYDLLCKRFLVLLISEAVLEKYYHTNLDPLPEYREPKYGIYTKYVIPLPIGDTTYVEPVFKSN